MHRVLDLEKPNCVCCVAEHVFVAEVPENGFFKKKIMMSVRLPSSPNPIPYKELGSTIQWAAPYNDWADHTMLVNALSSLSLNALHYFCFRLLTLPLSRRLSLARRHRGLV
jgi:hypothetical protein